jgi:genome maintenance exonuclease 1
MKIEFHDGESVDLEFNEGKHQYHMDGEFVPAVTSVLSTTIAKQQFLMPWAVKMGAEWFKSKVEPSVRENHYSFKGDLSLDEVVDGIKRAYKKKSAGAIDLGRQVHEWCEQAILWKLGQAEIPSMPSNEEASNSINAFRDWVKQNEVEWMAAEQRVFSRTHKYAGTVDAVARVNDEFAVIDFKTSARIYEEYHLQVAAYAKCIEDIYGEPVEGAYILRFDKESGEFEASKSNHIDTDFLTFSGLLVGYRGLTKLRSRGKG